MGFNVDEPSAILVSHECPLAGDTSSSRLEFEVSLDTNSILLLYLYWDGTSSSTLH